MDFKEFKEKCFGKSIEEIKDFICDIENFWKEDVDLIKLTICVLFTFTLDIKSFTESYGLCKIISFTNESPILVIPLIPYIITLSFTLGVKL